MAKIVYNVTVLIENDVREEWLAWMRDHHIPDVMATGCFAENKLMKVLVDDPQAIATTYAFHYVANSMEDYQRYVDNHAEALRKDAVDRYGAKMNAFRTLLEVVE